MIVARLLQVGRVNLEQAQELVSQLQRFLCDKRVLLVLNNFEHRLDAADQVAKLLLGTPDLHVLVTSR